MIRTRLQGDTPFFPNMLNNGKVEVCLKEDVDMVIGEKDAEIHRLKQALWLERAKNADSMYRIFIYVSPSFEVPLNICGYSHKERGRQNMLTADKWMKIWLKVERLCRKKAEEYK